MRGNSFNVGLVFFQGFKGEPGEDGVMVSIAQKHLCVPLTPTKHHPSAHAASGFVSLLMEDKKTLMEL